MPINNENITNEKISIELYVCNIFGTHKLRLVLTSINTQN